MTEAPPPDGDQPGGTPSGSTPPPSSGSTPPPPPAGSGYGTPPPADYGSQPAYGTTPGYGYGSPEAYGGQVPAQGAYASWGQRVLSALIDYVAPFLVAGIIYSINRSLGAVVYIAAIAFALYQAYIGGKTGQSLGKRTIGLRLVAERTGQTIGGGMGIARYFLHIVDGIPCYLGYLWPLWDAKKQTFSDKIVSTVVVKV